VTKKEWIQRVTVVIDWEKEVTINDTTCDNNVAAMLKKGQDYCAHDKQLTNEWVKVRQKQDYEWDLFQKSGENHKTDCPNPNLNIIQYNETNIKPQDELEKQIISQGQACTIVKRYEVNYGICQNWYNHTYRSCILEIKKILWK